MESWGLMGYSMQEYLTRDSRSFEKFSFHPCAMLAALPISTHQPCKQTLKDPQHESTVQPRHWPDQVAGTAVQVHAIVHEELHPPKLGGFEGESFEAP